MNSGGASGEFALSVQSISKLKYSARRDPEEGVRQAAKQFEALFLQQMLKQMRAAVHALRRRYPQIYESDDKLVIDPSQVTPTRVDFRAAMEAITPASHRAAQAHEQLKEFGPALEALGRG